MTHDISPPPGTSNLWPQDIEQLTRLMHTVLATVRTHGYRPAGSPLYEPVELYTRLYGGDIRARLATFTTDREYALRPDLTGGLCRMVAQQLGPDGHVVTPLRLAASGRAFRHERLRPLRRREFYQVGIERIGGSSPQGGDLEILSLLRLSLMACGVHGGLLRVGHAALRPHLLGTLGEDDTVRRRIDKLLDLLSRHRVAFEPPRTGVDRALHGDTDRNAHPDTLHVLGETRRALLRVVPEAPEFDHPDMAQAALEEHLHRALQATDLTASQREAFMGLTWVSASLGELIDTIQAVVPDAEHRLGEALGHVDDCLSDLEPLTLRFSLGMARGLGYYTGITFEVDAPVLGPDVCQVAGGGRYDDVVAALGGPAVPAAGFAIGVERLHSALCLMRGPKAVQLQWAPPEPLLLCFSNQPDDQNYVAALAHRIKGEGASVAIHPEPVAEEEHSMFLTELQNLPGRPYRYVLLFQGGELQLAALDDDDGPQPTDLETLLMMFTQPQR
ncbi:MAG: ATP phosphoribosyltransferase regulatory subunit [Myxococcota bacterium]